MPETPKFPMSLPGGQMMPFMSARRRHEVCDTVFEMLGGTERLHHEANRDRESYWDFMKLWQKGLPRAVVAENTNSEGVEEALKRLDAAENAKTINASPSEIHDMSVVDVHEQDD